MTTGHPDSPRVGFQSDTKSTNNGEQTLTILDTKSPERQHNISTLVEDSSSRVPVHNNHIALLELETDTLNKHVITKQTTTYSF